MSTTTIDFYLVIGQKVTSGSTKFADGRASVRTAKTLPTLQRHEVAIAMSMELPLALFMRPNLTAKIVVPADQAPVVITPEVTSNIARVLQEQLGITLHIDAPEAEAPHVV